MSLSPKYWEQINANRKTTSFKQENTFKIIRDVKGVRNKTSIPIDQFWYIKTQPNTVDLSMRLWGITTEFMILIAQGLVLRSIVLGWILIYLYLLFDCHLPSSYTQHTFIINTENKYEPIKWDKYLNYGTSTIV